MEWLILVPKANEAWSITRNLKENCKGLNNIPMSSTEEWQQYSVKMYMEDRKNIIEKQQKPEVFFYEIFVKSSK